VGVRPAVEEDVFHALAHFGGDVGVDAQLTGVDDAHVQACGDAW